MEVAVVHTLQLAIHSSDTVHKLSIDTCAADSSGTAPSRPILFQGAHISHDKQPSRWIKAWYQETSQCKSKFIRCIIEECRIRRDLWNRDGLIHSQNSGIAGDSLAEP